MKNFIFSLCRSGTLALLLIVSSSGADNCISATDWITAVATVSNPAGTAPLPPSAMELLSLTSSDETSRGVCEDNQVLRLPLFGSACLVLHSPYDTLREIYYECTNHRSSHTEGTDSYGAYLIPMDSLTNEFTSGAAACTLILIILEN